MAFRMWVAFLPLAAAPAAAVAGVVPLTGTLYFSEDFNSTGLYTLDTGTGEATLVGTSGVVGLTVGLAPTGNLSQLWGSQWFGLNLIEADGSSFELLSDGVVGGIAEGLAYDAGTGTLYGAINTLFFTIDTATGQVDQLLSDGEIDYEGLAFGNGGVYGLPGFDDEDTHLWFFDLQDGSWSIVGDTGIDWIEAGLAFDPIAGVLYAKNGYDSTLYSIDPFTAVTTAIGDTGILSGGGLAFVVPEPAAVMLLVMGTALLIPRRRR